MSARIPPGFAEMWIRWNTPGDVENMYSAIGLDLAAGSTITPTIAGQLDDIVEGALDDILSSSYTQGPSHFIVGQDGGDIRVDSPRTPAAGSAASTAVSPAVALLVTKTTGTGGRRGRGRMYIPGLPESFPGSDGSLGVTNQGTAQTAVTAMLNGLVAHADVDGLVLFHDTAPFTPTPITNLVVQLYVATQRRRQRP